MSKKDSLIIAYDFDRPKNRRMFEASVLRDMYLEDGYDVTFKDGNLTWRAGMELAGEQMRVRCQVATFPYYCL